MKRLVVVALASVTVACEQAEPEAFYTPPELEPLRQLAMDCMLDTEVDPIQHSEHCVIVSETSRENRKEECELSQSYPCLRYRRAHDNIYATYQAAIITSLMTHGLAEEIEAEAIEGLGAHIVFFDAEFMRGLFNKCLQEEEENLERRGLKRVHTVVPRTLADGQLCIQKGDPEFKTEKL